MAEYKTGNRFYDITLNLKANIGWFVLLISFVFSWFIFDDFWVETINRFWVNPIASHCKGLLFNIYLVFILFIIIIYYRSALIERRIYTFRLICSSCLAIIHLVCVLSGKWEYYWTFSSFIYFIPFILDIILFLKLEKIEPIVSNPRLEIEQPVYDKQSDSYGRAGYIESISKLLVNSFYDNQSFAIGITGSWGSGKTSFVHLLKKELKRCDNDVIIIDFEPWFCQTPQCIIQDFFNSFEKIISVYSPSLRRHIKRYAQSLSDIKGTNIGLWINSVINAFCSAGIRDQYLALQNELNQLSIKVVVVIDDLDRLDKEEILTVLHLIRNTANFPYVQFIVAYDKDYVTKAIGGENECIYRPTQYLEKIFNTEIILPKYEEKVICNELFNLLKDNFESYGVTETDFKNFIYDRLDNHNESNSYIIPYILHTKRDVIRFANSFKLNFSVLVDRKINKEINIRDFFFIELIRYGYPDHYNDLRNNVLKILKLDKDSIRFIYPQYNTKDKDYLKIDDVLSWLLDKLFSSSNLQTSNRTSVNDISHIRSYLKYFAYRHDYETLLMAELDKLISEKDSSMLVHAEEYYDKIVTNEFSDKLLCYFELIERMSKEGNKIDFYKELEKVYFFLEVISFSSKIGLKFEVLNATSVHLRCMPIYSEIQLQSYFRLWILIISNLPLLPNDYSQIFQLLLIREEVNKKMKCSIDGYADIFKLEFKKVTDLLGLSKAIGQFIIDSATINPETLIISIDSLRKIQLGYLGSFLSNVNSYKEVPEFLDTFCEPRVSGNEKEFNEKAIELIRNYIELNKWEYISSFINDGNSDNNNYCGFPIHYSKQVFGSNENLRDFLMGEELDSIENINKVRNFWRLYEKNDYKELTFVCSDLDKFKRSNFKEQIVALEGLEKIDDDFNRVKSLKISKVKSSQLYSSLTSLSTRLSRLNLNISYYNEVSSAIENMKENLIYILRPNGAGVDNVNKNNKF